MGCCRLSRLGCCQDADEGGGRATAGDVGVKEEEEEEEVPQGRCLNLTGCHLHDLGDVDIPEDLVELDLTDNRISKLDPRIGHLAQLRKLSLERNLFDDEDVYPISRWHTVDGLIELILRDNKLRTIPDVSIFKSLTVFDASFNVISSLSGLSKVSKTLKKLYVSHNEINKVEELEHLHSLQILELGANRLRVMENLQTLTSLQELYLEQNHIRIVNLCGLNCVEKIDLQSNRLTSMMGFQECVALEELHPSHNGIQKMEGLSTLENLRLLDISSNKLTAISYIEKLTRLDELWLNDNQIASLEGIDQSVYGSRERLTTIYLERNPCASLPDYSIILRKIFPNLQQIDSDIFMSGIG
ncbi:hypothetical protein C4D60_Mb06t15350 [Musa balbisiana]|uniref:Protein phosphatase 1 regulatory subunit 7 n=1 Tax=Musa balbisiana TaxID=52838 RepID=A0A4S8IN74_MUSBA|nr:hypothetical protein C4D60_Mb06t15350 [Musa balbisiana]